jgi:hypothetical protein
VFGEGLLDLGIEGFQAFVEGEDAAGKLGDDARGQSCPGSTIDWAFAAVIARAATSTEPRTFRFRSQPARRVWPTRRIRSGLVYPVSSTRRLQNVDRQDVVYAAAVAVMPRSWKRACMSMRRV